MEVTCPRCQAILYLEPVSEGTPVRCSACNALFTCPGPVKAPTVIDVHAEPVPGTYEPPEATTPEEEPYSSVSEPSQASQDRPRRYVVVEKHISVRDTPDFGCCGCGCLLMLLLFLLFMVGCASMALA